MFARFSKLNVALSAAVLVVVAGFAAPAMAQGGRGGGGGGGGGMMGMMGGWGGGGMDAPVTKAEMDRYSKMLKFTDDQKEASKALFEGFEAAFKPKADAARKAMEDAREEFRETRDPGVWTGVGEKMAKMREDRTAAEKQLLEDVKSILTPEQTAQWPRVERERRRESVMRSGIMSGERADLMKLVENMKLSDEAQKAVQPVLDTYEADIDPVLVKRAEVTEKFTSQGNKLREAFMGGGDMSEVNKMFEEGRVAAMKVRDTNRRYAKQIEGVLSGEDQGKFISEFRKESYPQIYRTARYGTKVLDAAAAFELDTTAKTSLAAIKDDYNQRTNTMNEQAEKAQDTQEESMTIQTMMGMRDNEDMRKVRDARRELETKTIEQVKALLTPEQVAKLPERGADNGPGGQGGDTTGRPARNNNNNSGAGDATGGGGNRRNRTPAEAPAPK